MGKKLYAIDIRICGTAYVVAYDEADAREAVKALHGTEVTLSYVSADGFEVYGGSFHPAMPELTVTPVATCWGSDEEDNVEVLEEFTEEDK